MIEINNTTGLVITDMQNYYLDKESAYCKYFDSLQPGSLEYILERSKKTVIPNIKKLLYHMRLKDCLVIYLRLCSSSEDRLDLHHFFRETYIEGTESGFPDIYPVFWDPMADIIEDIAPLDEDIIINKTTYSAFTSSDIDEILTQHNITTLVFTGLATSQCVETTARDASDLGYNVIHIEDGQTDYDEFTHQVSLFASQGVCGGNIYSTKDFLSITG